MPLNLIILSSNIHLPPWAYNLGREIHMTRIILFDMLIKNKITKNDIIVTMNDRKFLYENIFTNIIDFYTALTSGYLDHNKYNIINLFEIIVHHNCKDFFKIYYMLPNKFYNNDIVAYIKNINYLNLNYDFLNNNFFIIHHRYDCDIFKLITIIKKIKEVFQDIHIVIFHNDKSKINSTINKYNNMFVTDNLQEYASLLKNPNCKLLITEWFGGGQLAQYCSNSNIIIYFDAYIISSSYVEMSPQLHEQSMTGNVFHAYDFKTTTNYTRFYYHNFQEMIENINKDNDAFKIC